MFETRDLGAIPTGNAGLNYSSNFYRINDWYKAWLPDDAHLKELHDTKTVYNVRIRYANNTNATFAFHGPRGADENPGPVKWVRPYFDCGRSNTWKFAAIVPIVDIYPRHTQFRHIEYPVYTAASVMEIDFNRIDINQVSKELVSKQTQQMCKCGLLILKAPPLRPLFLTDFFYIIVVNSFDQWKSKVQPNC